MSETLIEARNVSKKFCRSLKRSLWYGMLDIADEVAGRAAKSRPLRPDEFWAVRDVSFELKRGECLGLIGRNGAGKTTLLRMFNGLIKPDAGSLTLRGRVGALIALGAGFNPILTGRENIYVNGSVLGLSKREINAKIEDIIDFAGIHEFIDSPVRNYSSGMQVRLGFATATALEPDVLLLDEVLAVGDAAFRAKCYSRLAKLQEKAAVIFVSHDMASISHICNRVLHFRKGIPAAYDVIQGIEAYNRDNREASPKGIVGARVLLPPVEEANFELERTKIISGESVEVILGVRTTQALRKPVISFVISDEAEQPILCWHTSQFDVAVDIPEGSSELRFRVEPVLLTSGTYYCSILLSKHGSLEHLVWFDYQVRLIVETGKVQVNVPVLVPYRGHTLTPVKGFGSTPANQEQDMVIPGPVLN